MSCIMDRATGCCLTGRAGEQQSSGCASQGLVERSEGALTHYLKSPTTTSSPLPTFARVCDSHGRGMTSAPHRRARFFCFFLRMDAQTLGGEEEEEEEKKKTNICPVAHAYVLRRTLRQKQSWLSVIRRLWKQICLNAFIVS